MNHQAIVHIADHIVMKKNHMEEAAANHLAMIIVNQIEEIIKNHVMMIMINQAAEKIENSVMTAENQIVEIAKNHMVDVADTKITKVKKIY